MGISRNLVLSSIHWEHFGGPQEELSMHRKAKKPIQWPDFCTEDCEGREKCEEMLNRLSGKEAMEIARQGEVGPDFLVLVAVNGKLTREDLMPHIESGKVNPGFIAALVGEGILSDELLKGAMERENFAASETCRTLAEMLCAGGASAYFLVQCVANNQLPHFVLYHAYLQGKARRSHLCDLTTQLVEYERAEARRQEERAESERAFLQNLANRTGKPVIGPGGVVFPEGMSPEDSSVRTAAPQKSAPPKKDAPQSPLPGDGILGKKGKKKTLN